MLTLQPTSVMCDSFVIFVIADSSKNPTQVSFLNPKVRMLGDDAAVITYYRIVQSLSRCACVSVKCVLVSVQCVCMSVCSLVVGSMPGNATWYHYSFHELGT